jgi:UDPglucose 6-dehydrogenase
LKVTVIGSGYVGLVVGACLADAGNRVYCVDIDPDKVDRLSQGDVPFFEPGLESMVKRNVEAERLSFTTETVKACLAGEVIFIAVGTPQGDDGSAELRYVYSVAEEIGDSLSGDEPGAQIEGQKIILTKSTVPIGTSDEVSRLIGLSARHPYVVCSNPEFLKEGDALNDFLKPDRMILGVPETPAGAGAEVVIRRLYASFYRKSDRMQVMNVRSSEMTKYAANALLATKISFMNELSQLAEEVGADIERVRMGIGADPRIGYAFLFAGAGYGGSCFPKDVKALRHLSVKVGKPLGILEAVDQANQRQKQLLFQRAERYYQERGGLSGRRFAVWGLSFKPRTDDMREAPSIDLIQALIASGATIRAYDPEARAVAAEVFSAEISSGQMELCERAMDCVDDADALFIVTEWRLFHHPDFDQLNAKLKAPVIFDGRNLYDPQQMRSIGFSYFGVGRGESVKSITPS